MSTVILDTITGKSTATTITIGSTPVVSASANSMTIRGEGSSQTSIQQGLCKGFCVFAGGSFTTTLDSFNMSGGTDNGTGDYTVTISTDMASVNYATIHNKDDGTTNNWSMSNENNGRTKATGSCHVMSTYGGTSTNNTKYDTVRMYVSLMGDLA